MKKYVIKIVAVHKGKYKVLDGNPFISKDTKDLPRYISTKIRPSALMKKVVKKAYGTDESFYGNICGNCVYMLTCPKVKDDQKKLLKSYPFITDGLELVLIDKEIKNDYENAKKEYDEKIKQPFYQLIDDKELTKRLENDGISVPIISVFGCKKFRSDDDTELINRIKTLQSRQRY